METIINKKLDIVNISKGFEEGDVLKQVSFSIKEGEFVSILGPSGCGKTTLLRIIMGLLNQDSGSIYKDGREITSQSLDKRGMGIVFQNYALFENMTVLKNVEYALRFHKDKKNKSRLIAEDMVKLVGLWDHKDKKPSLLSGGQQQRVAIARTLALNPDIVLFDEPMSALDAATRISMRKEIKEIQKHFNTTMIYVTHDQEEAFSMSDRIMVLENGKIAQYDTPNNIIANPANDYVQSFVIDNLKEKIHSLAKYKI